MQTIISSENEYAALDAYLEETGEKAIFLVCDGSIQFLKLDQYFFSLKDRTGIDVVRFSEFQSNPLYESVVEGVKQFRASGSGQIIAVGGGSAMDVAKCIKLFSNMDDTKNYLKQEIVSNDVKLLAVPTTAGTGSEATRYAVVYYEGAKQSVTDNSIIPSAVLFDPSVLVTLPLYQKKSTMMDALCHSIESFWSVNSTDESKSYARESIELIMANYKDSFENKGNSNEQMLRAAHKAGQAINITQTTAGHAMCYKLTSLYHIAHGHAAAVVNAKLWPWMINNTDKCIDKRGEDYLKSVFREIAKTMGVSTSEEAAEKYSEILKGLDLPIPENVREEDYQILKTSVNPVRLKNNPVEIDTKTIEMLYREILA